MVSDMVKDHSGRKEGKVLFNDALITYLQDFISPNIESNEVKKERYLMSQDDTINIDYI